MFLSLNTIGGDPVDLSTIKSFTNHYSQAHSHAALIIKQINDGYYLPFLGGKNNLTILDLGANVGLFSLHVKNIALAVYAFEPTKNHFSVLGDLTSELDKEDKILIYNEAISDKDGSLSFYTGDINSTMNSAVKHSSHNESFEVKCRELKSVIEKTGKINFCKMDIEGSEQAVVLSDGFNKFVYDSVDEFLIEVHEGLGANFSSIWGKLQSLGYNLTKINTDTIYAIK